MGEVYRARDTRLDRDVAIKILPDAFVANPERVARFQREAKTLAALNHPNIGGIHGLEESPSTGSGQAVLTALVMELVEGEDLSQRIARGAMPLDEVLPIAKQIAEALDAAHEQGIVHRDLKPANIKVRPDGTVKVLDFGLARAIEPAGAASSSVSLSPTITTPAMTLAGMILGTAAYMSPEQARGRTADKRSDIWAFGVVLYEMLTGRRAFEDEDVSMTLSKVLQREPDFDALPPSVPPRVSQVIRVCLRKDPKQRVSDIRDVRLALEGAFETAVPQKTAAVEVAPRRQVALAGTAALLAGALIATTVTWFATRPVDPVPPRVSRLSLAPPGPAALTINLSDRDLAITPDGSRLVYVGNGGTQIFVRALDALEPVAVFTGAPRGLFVSPDGQWIGFVESTSLKKVAVTGGPAITLTQLDNAGPRGATWGPGDTIIVATSSVTSGLQQVAAAGGSAKTLTTPDRAQGEADHLWPELLPGGRAVLFTIMPVTGGLDAAQVAVLDLQTGMYKVVVRGGSHAHYMQSGHLVYAAAGTLRAVPFDLAALQPRGAPVPVIADVMTKATGGVDAVVAGDGTLAYVSGGSATGTGSERTLVWVDRSGREEPLALRAGRHFDPRLSPDGSQIALTTEDAGNTDVWIIDVASGRRRRVTFDPGLDRYPLWTPDGKAVLFYSTRNGTQGVYRKRLDTDTSEERLFTERTRLVVPWSWSVDGQTLVTSELASTGASGFDLGALSLGGTPAWKSLLATAFQESQPVVSPDGKWMVYSSNEGGGGGGVYARPFPEVTAGVEQVSTEGGTNPVWTRAGRELVYRNRDTIVAVSVESSQTFRTGTPGVLFKGIYFDEVGTQWDVTRDGTRFLMLKSAAAAGDAAGREQAPPQITIVLNWIEELKRLVPAH
jgi:serine/threonine-protein kinase